MACDPDGFTRFDLDGRRYVGRTMAGKRAIGLYHRLQRMLGEAAKEDIMVPVAGTPEERRANFILVLLGRLGRMPGIEALVDETLDGYAIERAGFPALSLPRDIDEAYRGRPAESMTAAARVWNDEGFFQMPGSPATTPPKETVPAPSAEKDTV